MRDPETVSRQLRQRRKERGLSLSDVARRAGTSPATLLRYENGWTRFETRTLRKLAAALDCTLRIELRPEAAGRRPRAGVAVAVRRLKRLFWDHRLTAADLRKHPHWVVERVLDYGNLRDVHLLRDVMGTDAFLRTAANASRVSPRTRCFWSQMAVMEGIRCTRRSFRRTARAF